MDWSCKTSLHSSQVGESKVCADLMKIKRCDDDERKEDLLGGEKMWEFIDVQAAGVIAKAVGFGKQ